MFLKFKLFFIPFVYFIETRIANRTKLLSWALIYFVPIFAYGYLCDGYLSFKLLLLVTLVYALYEIGYIYNDTETIKKETKPTLRLNNLEMQFYNENKTLVYLFRVSIGVLLTAIYVKLYSVNIIYIWFVLPVFGFYNYIRNRFNLILHFVLVLFRFSLPFYLIDNQIESIFFSALLFPCINLIERCSEDRFGLHFFKSFILSNKKSGRYIYYAFISLLFILLYLFKIISNPNFLIISTYYLFLRFLTSYFMANN